MSNLAHYPSLADRCVIVTGGGSRIGAAIVEHFVRQGARVTFVDIFLEASNGLLEKLEGTGLQQPRFIPCDLKDISPLQSALARTAE